MKPPLESTITGPVLYINGNGERGLFAALTTLTFDITGSSDVQHGAIVVTFESTFSKIGFNEDDPESTSNSLRFMDLFSSSVKSKVLFCFSLIHCEIHCSSS